MTWGLTIKIVNWYIYPPFPIPHSQPGISQQIWVLTAETCSVATDVTFLGCAGRKHVQQRLFLLFLLDYGITVVANVRMSLLIKVNPRLNTLMYHFLSYLPFCDACYSSAVSPKMLADFLFEQKRIPFDLCAIQMYFWRTFADVECLMLAVMAYDRYVAICIHFFFFSFISISWRLITLQYCSGFCHTLTWISHGLTCIPHPNLPSHLPLHLIPLGLPNAPGLSACLMHPAWAGDLFHPR